MQIVWRLILGVSLPVIISGYLMLFYLNAFIFFHSNQSYDYVEVFLFHAIVIMPTLFAVYYPFFIQGFIYTFMMEFLNSKIKSNTIFLLISTGYGGLASIMPFYILPKVEKISESSVPLYIIGISTGFLTGFILRRFYLKSADKKLT